MNSKSFKSFLESQDIPEINKNGDCYVVSYRYISSHPSKKIKLVHGLVTGQGALQGLVYNHAWIEEGNKVLDLTLPKKHQKMDKKVYYALGHIKTTFEYNFQEVMEKSSDIGTYGPWEKVLLKNKY